MTPAQWAEHAERVRAEEVRRWREGIAATERKLKAQKRADERWGVVRYGDDHAALETLARTLWRQTFPGEPWPGFRLRWADTLNAPAPDNVRAVGRCGYRLKEILIDRKYHEQHPDRLRETVMHELAHAKNPSDGHGARFTATLETLRAAGARAKEAHMDRGIRPLKNVHAARVERAAPGGTTGPECYRAIKRTIDKLEARGVDVDLVPAWTVKRLPSGALIGVPSRRPRLRVDEALQRTNRTRRK